MADYLMHFNFAEHVTTLTPDHPHYPPLLKNMPDPPPILYCMGDPSCLREHSVAIVGSRKCTPYGEKVAKSLAMELAGAGVPVVSGLARGIDTAAHQGCLQSGGKTIAVLGSGIMKLYPRENKNLALEIARNGAVISEFPLDSEPDLWHFPKRNRIIAGLSLGTVVVEAAEKSGALITAKMALEQGKDVFAVPGPVTSKASWGPHMLIKNGAKLVENCRDVLEEIAPLADRIASVKSSNEASGLDVREARILELVALEPLHVDALAEQTRFTPGECSQSLLNLELKGLIRPLPGKRYVRT